MSRSPIKLKSFFNKNVIQNINNSIFELMEIENEKIISSQYIKLNLQNNEEIVIINLDSKENRERMNWFQNTIKMCDYAIFILKGNKLNIFLVELKSNQIRDSKKQLDSARKFCDYLIEQYNINCNCTVNVFYRKIVFLNAPKLRNVNTKSDDKNIKKEDYYTKFYYQINNINISYLEKAQVVH